MDNVVACWHHDNLEWLLYHLSHNRIDLHGPDEFTPKGTNRLKFWLAKMHLKKDERIRIVHKRHIVAEATIISGVPFSLKSNECRRHWESAMELKDIVLRNNLPVKCPGIGVGSHRLDGHHLRS